MSVFLPATLLRQFILTAVACLIGASVLAGGASTWIIKQEILFDAEVLAVSVAKALAARERELLVADGRIMPLEPERRALLDANVRHFLGPFGIFKIKIYDAAARIVYSTDAGLIGQLDSKNEKLARLLASGVVTSAVERKNRIQELGGGTLFNRDVVETYIPFVDDDRVVGAFETYIDVSEARAGGGELAVKTIAVLVVLLATAFLALHSLMRRGTLALEDARAQLTRLACCDPLTGLANRRAVMDAVVMELLRSARNRSQPPAFAMIDIDHFKAINDTYGHQAGDAVIRAIGSRLRAAVRGHDVVGRYGGEEFLILLPDTNMAMAAEVGERVRQAVAAMPVGDIPVTISVGIAAAGDGDTQSEHVIESADKALYVAKRMGRNRVELAMPTVAASGSDH